MIEVLHSVASKLAGGDNAKEYIDIIGLLMSARDIGVLSASWLYTMSGGLIEQINRGYINLSQERLFCLLHLSVVAFGATTGSQTLQRPEDRLDRT